MTAQTAPVEMAAGPSAAVTILLTVSGDSGTVEMTAVDPDPAFISTGLEIGAWFVLGNIASAGHLGRSDSCQPSLSTYPPERSHLLIGKIYV